MNNYYEKYMKYKNKYLALKNLIGSGKKANCKACATTVSSLKEWKEGLCDECLNKKKTLGKGLSQVALDSQNNYNKLLEKETINFFENVCMKAKNMDEWNSSKCDTGIDKLPEAEKYKAHRAQLMKEKELQDKEKKLQEEDKHRLNMCINQGRCFVKPREGTPEYQKFMNELEEKEKRKEKREKLSQQRKIDYCEKVLSQENKTMYDLQKVKDCKNISEPERVKKEVKNICDVGFNKLMKNKDLTKDYYLYNQYTNFLIKCNPTEEQKKQLEQHIAHNEEAKLKLRREKCDSIKTKPGEMPKKLEEIKRISNEFKCKELPKET